MLYTKKFVFTVSLCAMLAANPVLAVTNPVEAKAGAFSGEVGKVGTVYSDWAGRADSGIAGVTYVNSAVDAAGNAAQWAENHAAAAAQSAKSAADSAAQAASKVAIAQGTDNKNKAMVTDAEGSVYAGYVAPDMIKGGAKIENLSSYSGFVLWSDEDGAVSWKTVDHEVLADNAVTTPKISGAAVTTAKIADNAVTSAKIAAGAVTSVKIENGAVTLDKINPSSEYSGALITNATGVAEWGKIEPGWINTSGYVSGALVSNASGVAEWGKVTPEMISATGLGTGWSKSFLVFDDDGDLTTYTGTANTVVGFNSNGKLYVYGGSGIFGATPMSAPSFTLNPEVFGSTGVAYTGNRVLTFDRGVMAWGKIMPIAINNLSSPGVMTFDADGNGKALSGDSGQVLISTDGGVPTWGKIGPVNTEGVVGMVPVGSADSNTYGQLWIE